MQTTTDNEGSYILTVDEFGSEPRFDHEKGAVLKLESWTSSRSGASASRTFAEVAIRSRFGRLGDDAYPPRAS